MNKDRFDFLNIRISEENLGTRELYNRFLYSPTPDSQLDSLLKDFEGYKPIGVCLSDDYCKGYGTKYYPVILENDNGERLWIHIPYETWKNEYDGLTQQVCKLIVPAIGSV